MMKQNDFYALHQDTCSGREDYNSVYIRRMNVPKVPAQDTCCCSNRSCCVGSGAPVYRNLKFRNVRIRKSLGCRILNYIAGYRFLRQEAWFSPPSIGVPTMYSLLQ